MLKRILFVFLLMLTSTGIYIVIRNLFMGGTYDWYDGIGISALATFFYWVLVSVLERKKRS